MQREEILFYLTRRKLYFYSVKSKKEYIEEVDTSFFFNFGEITNVEKGADFISDCINKNKLFTSLIKPIIYVLYNDITYCDLEFLYKNILQGLNYSEIKFIPLTDIISKLKYYKRIILKDDNYFTIFMSNYKTFKLSEIDFEPIFIGDESINNLHYKDKDIIWHTFKSSFTKE